jgi:hypothetical protein
MPAASSSSSANVLPRFIKLIPVESKTGKPSLASLAVLLLVFQISYYVSGTADHVIQFLEHYRGYFETKIDGLVVPIDQAKQTIQNAEHPQLTPKNEHHEKSGNPPATYPRAIRAHFLVLVSKRKRIRNHRNHNRAVGSTTLPSGRTTTKNNCSAVPIRKAAKPKRKRSLRFEIQKHTQGCRHPFPRHGI